MTHSFNDKIFIKAPGNFGAIHAKFTIDASLASAGTVYVIIEYDRDTPGIYSVAELTSCGRDGHRQQHRDKRMFLDLARKAGSLASCGRSFKLTLADPSMQEDGRIVLVSTDDGLNTNLIALSHGSDPLESVGRKYPDYRDPNDTDEGMSDAIIELYGNGFIEITSAAQETRNTRAFRHRTMHSVATFHEIKNGICNYVRFRWNDKSDQQVVGRGLRFSIGADRVIKRALKGELKGNRTR